MGVERRAGWLALAVAAATATLSAASAAAAAGIGGPDRAFETPIAKPGSAPASDRRIGEAELRRELNRLMNRAPGPSGAWVYMTDEGGGRTERLYNEDASKRRTPASNMKLFTTATALDVLGEDKRLRTRVYADGTISGDVLRGDLYLVGGGDPALASSSFATGNRLPLTRFSILSAKVALRGIEKVRGDVIVDDTIFDRVRGVPDSNWATSSWIGPLGGLTYNAGIAAGGGYVSDPGLATGERFREDLRERGIRVTGGVELGELPGRVNPRNPMAMVRSPEIGSMIDPLNNHSLNFFAEMLLKRIAAQRRKPGTTKRGTRMVERFAKSLGSGIDAKDGSGLTSSTDVSPAEVGRLLDAMLDEPTGDAFYESLPIAGREGTLANRMRGTAAEGACRGKTGTLTGVSALSGYCRAGGRLIVFSILMNGVSSDSYAHELQDAMVALIARYRD